MPVRRRPAQARRPHGRGPARCPRLHGLPQGAPRQAPLDQPDGSMPGAAPTPSASFPTKTPLPASSVRSSLSGTTSGPVARRCMTSESERQSDRHACPPSQPERPALPAPQRGAGSQRRRKFTDVAFSVGFRMRKCPEKITRKICCFGQRVGVLRPRDIFYGAGSRVLAPRPGTRSRRCKFCFLPLFWSSQTPGNTGDTAGGSLTGDR